VNLETFQSLEQEECCKDDKIVGRSTERMDQTEELLAELRAWAAQRRGNQALVGKALGVSKQSVSGWITGVARPNLETGLKLMAFLKSHKQSKTKEPVE